MRTLSFSGCMMLLLCSSLYASPFDSPAAITDAPLMNMAKQGDSHAQLELAKRYIALDPPDYHQALPWIEKAADRQLTAAQAMLGELYRLGYGGLGASDLEAAKLFQRAALKGNAYSQLRLGMLYARRAGDFTTASTWIRRAAEQDFPPAQFAMSLLYQAGKGVKTDTAAASEWLSKAASQGFLQQGHEANEITESLHISAVVDPELDKQALAMYPVPETVVQRLVASEPYRMQPLYAERFDVPKLPLAIPAPPAPRSGVCMLGYAGGSGSQRSVCDAP